MGTLNYITILLLGHDIAKVKTFRKLAAPMPIKELRLP